MKKLMYAFLGLLLAGSFGLAEAGPCYGLYCGSAQQAYYGRGDGYLVCYKVVRGYKVGYWHGQRYVKYIGTKNMCGFTKYSCRYYGAYKYGWYQTYGDAQRATYRCNHTWY